MNLSHFKTEPFPKAIKTLFAELNIPINPISEDVFPVEVTFPSYKASNPAHALIEELYAIGTIDDQAFSEVRTVGKSELETEDYDFIMVFGIKLKNGQHPTRSQLAEITRLANASFNNDQRGNPVTVIFQYDDHIALANTERQTRNSSDYRQGEKLGKVSLLRDIDIENTHSGHILLLRELKINEKVVDFQSLYKHWQVTFSVSLLNKKFYGELQNWYFWALQEVHFPNPPLRIDFSSDSDFDEALKEHKGKNVIRLLTRILFIWFIKEKGLIPEEIFDEKVIADRIINEFVPQKPEGLFLTGKQNSKYYRAILQNLFFATLNQPCKQREFRADGKHQNVTQLMRYKSYFKDAEYFVELMESKVPFMNGGLFECLDKPHETLKGKQGGDRIIYVDGFSDRADNDLLVPDFLFFDADEEVDLSKDYGNTKYKKSKTRGLITILKSYKFTITENTPIDEEVALDPELLGKVFENLLASYNPETKTTARKQTGSFYTPREIVDYMVNESLIAYLKTNLTLEAENLDEKLHQLVSYSGINPFEHDESTPKAIIKALDKCTILDPACGSGAYPMGILQKMVHILHKIDPKNTEWKNRQLRRVDNAIAELEQLDDTSLRESTIRELEAQKADIEESFANNELDYGRKLYLIENCIFGVDIQPIATQISKLRFFISLVVDQKVDAAKDNFGVRPLPNLETKFVAANTLIGIDKPKVGETLSILFDKKEVQTLEIDLKKIRQRLFSAKTPSLKRQLREQDRAIREQMSELLEEKYGSATARQLANWDPYDQNTSSPFFDKEWMFDIREGFDIVIGNPPYVLLQSQTKDKAELNYFKFNYKTAVFKVDLYHLFIEQGLRFLKNNGILTYINPSNFQTNNYTDTLRKIILSDYQILHISNFDDDVFEASVNTCILSIKNTKDLVSTFPFSYVKIKGQELIFDIISRQKQHDCLLNDGFIIQPVKDEDTFNILNRIERTGLPLKSVEIGGKVNFGMQLRDRTEYEMDVVETSDLSILSEFHEPCLTGKNIQRYSVKYSNLYCYFNVVAKRGGCWDRAAHSSKNKVIVRQIGLTPIAAIDEDGFALLNSAFMITASLTNTKYILSIINSKITEFYWINKFSDKRKTFPKIKGTYLELIPIPQLSSESQQPFIDLVDKILAGKKAGEDTQAWEDEIDLRVYKLYELTHAEVLVIDPAFGMSEEAYEGLVF
ncbi:MAG: TaqI-like C-terminal specificity domain-containing protein [Spirosomataceae bacterium]